MAFKNRPIFLDLEPGKYLICRCGESKKKPYCDGSHPDNSWPQVLDAKVAGEYAICDCGLTGSSPKCDNTHARFQYIKPPE